MSISEIINEIGNGEVVLPAIQRDFVWNEERIVMLFDSLFRGYPVGIVMIWETYDAIQFRKFSINHQPGDLYKFEDNPKGRRIKLVLDGQQRLSSIYVGLKGSLSGKHLYYDVLSGRESDDYSEMKYGFAFLTDQQASKKNSEIVDGGEELEGEKSFWVRLSSIFGRSPLDIMQMRAAIANQLKLSDLERLRMELNVQNASYVISDNSELLKTQTVDSKLSADDPRRKSIFDILEIFVRINTQGIPLRRSDLIVSLLRLYWNDASTVLPEFIKSVNDGNNFEIDNDFVIRCMFVTAGIGTRLDFDLLRTKSNVDRLKRSHTSCFNAIRSTLDFVRSHCKIDSTRLIGGPSTLIPFVYYSFLALGNVLPKNSIGDARKALYLFAFSKVFTQHVDSRTGSFIRSYMPSTEDIINGQKFSLKSATDYVYAKTSFSNADESLFANNRDLALSVLQGFAGGKVLFASNKPEVDHIFPRSVLNEKGIDPQIIDSLGNLWILPQKLNRNKSAADPKTFLKDVDDDILASALIDRELLDNRSFRRFIREREVLVVDRVSKLTGLGPDVFAYLSEVESSEDGIE